MRLLLTRPLAEAQASIARLRHMGHTAIAAPVIEIVPLAGALRDGAWQGVVLTSAHATAGLTPAQLDRLATLPTFAVGRRSAEAARASGFERVHAADGDETALARLVVTHLPAGSTVLYLAGRERRGALAGQLWAAGYGCQIVETYDAVGSVAFAPDVLTQLRDAQIDAVLHYSARSAAIFVTLAGVAGLGAEIAGLHHLCLSPAVAAQLATIAPTRIRIAARPDEATLFALLEPDRLQGD